MKKETAMSMKRMPRFSAILLLIIFIWGKQAMAKDAVPPTGSFSISLGGGMQYGSRTTFFDGKEKFYFAQGDTIGDESKAGVGVFELHLQDKEVVKLRDVAKVFCNKDVPGKSDPFQPQVTFQVVCEGNEGVTIKYGSMNYVPEDIKRGIYGAVREFEERAWSEGRRIVKLDFSTTKVEYKDNGFTVSVRFSNSGNQTIRFKTPDQLPGNEVGGKIGVGSRTRIGKNGSREETEGGWAFSLSGKEILNKGEFPDGIVTLHPGEDKILRVRSVSDYKASKGEYEFTGIAFMNIESEGEWWTGARVDFKPIKTRIIIDRDYPSTPKEREEWEARRRAAMLSWPVKPGEAFPEDGLYRAVRVGSGSRSLQVQPFKAGDVATTENVRLLSESASGNYLDGPVQWVWESSPPVPSSKPFTMVEGTEQVCEPGTVCSRSGRWLARYSTMDWKYGYDLSQTVTVQQGKSMPAIQGNLTHATWEWIGI